MPKGKKEILLTKELIEKLTADGYCFDIDHAEEIRRLAAEVDVQRRAREEDVAKVKAEHASALKEKSDRIYDLEKELEKLRDDLKMWQEMYDDVHKKLEAQNAEVAKKLIRNSTWPAKACTDARHLKYEGLNPITVIPPELLVIAFNMVVAGPGMDPSDSEVTLLYPPRYNSAVQRGNPLRDVKALGKALKELEEKLKQSDLPKEEKP